MRTQKAIKNAIVSMGYQVIAVICGLITPRLILSAFGSTYNGVISSANQFLQMISILKLGVAGATRVALYKPLADNDVLAVSRIIKSNKNYMRKVGLAVIGYTLVLSVIYPFISHNDLSRTESGVLIAIVGVGVFAEYFFSVTNETLLSAAQSVYVYYSVQSIALIVNTLFAVVLIKAGCSIFVVKLVSAFVFLVSPICLNIIVKRKYKLISDCEPDNTAIQQRGAAAFHSVANIIHENTDLVVLTLFTDAKLISVYTVYLLVVGKVRQILLMLTNGLEGAFGNMWAKGEMEAFEQNFRFFEYLIFALTSVIFSCVAILILPFIKLYTLGVNDINYIRMGFAVLTVITEAMHCIRNPYLIIVQATGNYKATKMGALYEAVINLTLSVVLVNVIGLNGVMLGTLVANTFRTIQYAFFISTNIIKGSIKRTSKRLCWFMVNSFAIVSAQQLAFRNLPEIATWQNWILNGMVVFSIAVIVTFCTSKILFPHELKRALGIILKLIKRNGGRSIEQT